MILFIYYFFFIFFFLEILDIDFFDFLKNYYFILFICFFITNKIFVNNDCTNPNEKIMIDLLYKYHNLSLNKSSFLSNDLKNTSKKIFLYLFGIKYHRAYLIFKLYMLKYSYLWVFWKPLFKKSSYFGYFRSNRSKWIK